jgi:hypothetical protein
LRSKERGREKLAVREEQEEVVIKPKEDSATLFD